MPIQDMTNYERRLHVQRTRDYIGAFNFFVARAEDEAEHANSSKRNYRNYIKELQSKEK